MTQANPIPETTKAPFQVTIDNSSIQQHSPNLLVNWSITPETLQEIKVYGTRQAYIAILIGKMLSPENTKKRFNHEKECTCHRCTHGIYEVSTDDIRLIPLEDKDSLVKIYRPGDYIVTSCLVLSTGTRNSKTRDSLIGGVRNLILNNDAFIWEQESEDSYDARDNKYRIIPSTITHSIQVDESLLTPPISERMEWWLTLWTPPAKDPCAMKKRIFHSLFIQPWIVGAWIILRAIVGLCIALWLFLIGWRHTNLKALLHPFEQDIMGSGENWILYSDIYASSPDERNDNFGYFHLYTKDGKKRSWFGKIFLLPFTWVGLSVAGTIIYYHPMKVLWGVGIVAAIVAAIFLIIGAIALYTKYMMSDVAKKRRFDQFKATVKAPTPIHVQQKHISLRRRFLELEAKACIPYAKR